MDIQKYIAAEADPWVTLKQFTDARIALGKTGVAIPLKALQQFRLAHAHARDAVFSQLETSKLTDDLHQFSPEVFLLHSKANSREAYLQNPNAGREPDDASVKQLQQIHTPSDISIILADGLSATAINEHAIGLLQCLWPLLVQHGFSIAPISIVEQARVAVGDAIGMLLQAAFTVVLIGERPGLSSPDSLGVYLTYAPRKGLTDESRNCISNIRVGGLDYEKAAQKIHFFACEAFRLQYSGVRLKDSTGLPG